MTATLDGSADRMEMTERGVQPAPPAGTADAEGLVQALEHNPGDLKSRIRLARIRTAEGRIWEAVALCEGAPDIPGRQSDWFPELGRLLLQIGDFAGALVQLARCTAQNLGPERLAEIERARAGLTVDAQDGISPTLKRRYLRAMDCLGRGEASAAAALLEPITRSAPTFAPAWVGICGARQVLGLPRPSGPAPPGGRAGMARRLSPRGLLFDPRERFALRSCKQALAGAADAADFARPGDKVLTLDPGRERIEFRPVLSVDGRGQDVIDVVHRTPTTFMMALESGAVAGRGVPITWNGEVISDYVPPAHLTKHRLTLGDGAVGFDRAGFFDGQRPVRYFDTPALLMTGIADLSFGDWVIRYPPRLALADAAGLDCPVLVNREIPDQYLDMLAALGVPRERVLFHDVSGVSVFPRLYAPSWPMLHRDHPMKGCYDIYRRAWRGAPAAAERPLLYLARDEVANRRLLNEAEVRSAFERRGFTVVHPERLGFDQTLELFAQPSCVAGPYGSAFRNIVFSNPAPLCLAIMPPYGEDYMPGVALWIGMLGGRLAYVRGAGVGEGHPNLAPWTAPLDDVGRALDRVLAFIAANPPAS